MLQWPGAPIDMRWVGAPLVHDLTNNDCLTRTRTGITGTACRASPLPTYLLISIPISTRKVGPHERRELLRQNLPLRDAIALLKNEVGTRPEISEMIEFAETSALGLARSRTTSEEA
jgi:hypothetical protein